jgi:hypothetical protein
MNVSQHEQKYAVKIGTYIGHAFVPAVVSADGQNQVTAIFFQAVGEVFGTSLDVVRLCVI